MALILNQWALIPNLFLLSPHFSSHFLSADVCQRWIHLVFSFSAPSLWCHFAFLPGLVRKQKASNLFPSLSEWALLARLRLSFDKFTLAERVFSIYPLYFLLFVIFLLRSAAMFYIPLWFTWSHATVLSNEGVARGCCKYKALEHEHEQRCCPWQLTFEIVIFSVTYLSFLLQKLLPELFSNMPSWGHTLSAKQR